MKKPLKKPRKKTRSIPVVLLGILALATILRFWRLRELFHWTLDEEYWAYVSYNIATGYHVPLIGGPISGTGLYLGPLFVWIMAIPFAAFSGNPVGAALVSSFLGVLSTFLIFRVGKALFDSRSGTMAALLWASSFLIVIYERKFWNATPIPLLTLATLYCLYNLAKGKHRWAYALALVMAVAFHSHMTSGVLLVLVALSWIVLKLPVRKREIAISAVIFLLLQIPLVAFDIRHDFVNGRALVRILSQERRSTHILSALSDIGSLSLNTMARTMYMPAKRDIAGELTLCRAHSEKRYIPPVVLSTIALAGLAHLWRERKGVGAKLLFLTISVNFISLLWFRMRASPESWYGGQLNEYYLLPSFPATVLSVGFLFSSISRKGKGFLLTSILLAVVVILNSVAVLTATHSDGYAGKEALVKRAIDEIGAARFTLEVESDDPCLAYGYRYLFTFFGKEPVASHIDPQFSWLYQRRLPQGKPTQLVTIVRSGEKSYYQVDPRGGEPD